MNAEPAVFALSEERCTDIRSRWPATHAAILEALEASCRCRRLHPQQGLEFTGPCAGRGRGSDNGIPARIYQLRPPPVGPTSSYPSLYADKILAAKHVPSAPDEASFYQRSEGWNKFDSIKSDLRIGFSIDNFLSVEECDGLAAAARGHFASLDRTFDHQYRNHDRAMCFHRPLAAVLFDRLLPFFSDWDVENVVPIGFGNGGQWFPARLNECLKFNRYTGKSQHFSLHRDGAIAPHPGHNLPPQLRDWPYLILVCCNAIIM